MKLENLEEMDELLDGYWPIEVKSRVGKNLNRSEINNEAELVKKKISQPESDRSTAQCYQTFKEDTTPVLLKMLHATEKEAMLQSFL